MTGPDDGEDPDVPLVAQVWAQEVREISEEYPGLEVSCDDWGQFRAQQGDDVLGPVSCPAALRALIGIAKPRKATP